MSTVMQDGHVLLDLEVDGTTLTVDETNNRVGIGTASPSHTLEVAGDLDVTGGLSFDAGTAVTSIDTDISSVSGSDDSLASAKAIKTYVDSVATASDLDFQGDSGGALSIDLDSETLTIAGGTGATTTGSGNTLTVAVDAAQTGITSLLATDIKIGEDNETKIDFEDNNAINFYADNHKLIALTDANDGDAVLTVPTADKNFTIKGTDGSSAITALDIDMADAGKAVFNGEIEAASIDISGDADIDGTLEADAITVDGTALNEYIADTVGAMVTSNTETGISVTYEDGDNTLDFAVSAVDLSSGVSSTLPVGNGGTGATSLTDGGVLLGSGTGAVTAMSVLSDGEMIVGDGSGDPVAESGATLRTSIGVGTGDSPEFTDLTLSGGDLTFGNGQNATVSVTATAHDAAGKTVTISSGSTTAGTTNNIAGGDLTISAGQGKGSGVGGEIIFKTAAPGSSGSSLNALSERLRIDDNGNVKVSGTLQVTDSSDTASLVWDGGILELKDSHGGSPADVLRAYANPSTGDANLNTTYVVAKQITAGSVAGSGNSHLTFAATNTDGNQVKVYSKGGMLFKDQRTTNSAGTVLTIQTGDTDIAANDVLGQLNFQAPDEGTGTDAVLVAASIAAISEGDFSSSSNATKLSFMTGSSEAASEKMALSSAGVLTVDGGIGGTSLSAGAGVSDAASISTTVTKVGGIYKTTIIIDIQGLGHSQSFGEKIIGDDGEGSAYLCQLTNAVNGETIYAAEMICVETPAQSSAAILDIDLYTSAGDLAENQSTNHGSVAHTALITAGGNWSAGDQKNSSTASLAGASHDNRYVYLAMGTGGGGSPGTYVAYTAGKFVINIYGY